MKFTFETFTDKPVNVRNSKIDGIKLLRDFLEAAFGAERYNLKESKEFIDRLAVFAAILEQKKTAQWSNQVRIILRDLHPSTRQEIFDALSKHRPVVDQFPDLHDQDALNTFILEDHPRY